MDFVRLYSEYESAIERQKTIIRNVLEKLKAATACSDYKRISELNQLLNLLYTEKSEMEESAAQIKRYIT